MDNVERAAEQLDQMAATDQELRRLIVVHHGNEHPAPRIVAQAAALLLAERVLGLRPRVT